MERKGSSRGGDLGAKVTASSGSVSSPSAPGLATKDLWSLLSSLEPPSNKQAPADVSDPSAPASIPSGSEERDTFTLVVGSKGAGKSSLLAAFRNASKPEEIKPTTALDYAFVRLKAPSGAKAAVAHLWELAATTCVPDMIRVPLGPERILHGAVVVVLDLANPGDAVAYAAQWLAVLYRVLADVLRAKERHASDKAAVERLRHEALAGRYGPAHPDRDEVTPLPVPVLLVGNKYEQFREEDSAKRKGVTQALRFLAHQYGATLLFTSARDKALVGQWRTLMRAAAFRVGRCPLAKELDPARALVVPAGSDLFDDIGWPKSSARRPLEIPREQHDERGRLWRKIAAEYFAPSGEVRDAAQVLEETGPPMGPDDPAVTGGEGPGGAVAAAFPEPNIDRIRQRKREELRRHREQRKKLQDRAAGAGTKSRAT